MADAGRRPVSNAEETLWIVATTADFYPSVTFHDSEEKARKEFERAIQERGDTGDDDYEVILARVVERTGPVQNLIE